MEKTTTIRKVTDRIRRHPLLEDIPFETIIDYLVDFIQIIGVPDIYEEKTAVLEVKDYRASLPCDYISMIQVRTHHRHDDEASRHRIHVSYRYAGDSFHMSPDKPGPDRQRTDLTYKIQGGVIFTSTKDSPIEIAYRAISTDDEGYPLIPDTPKFMRAFESYVKKQRFTVLFDLGKIQPAVLNQALQDYSFNVGACISSFRTLSLDKAESIYNIWNSLVVTANEHKYGFMNTGAKEYLTIQP